MRENLVGYNQTYYKLAFGNSYFQLYRFRRRLISFTDCKPSKVFTIGLCISLNLRSLSSFSTRRVSHTGVNVEHFDFGKITKGVNCF